MKGLLNKLKGKDKPVISSVLSADAMKPFFEANGIDMENIGFPYMDTRDNVPTDAYEVWFKDVQASPVRIDKNVSTIIKGKYFAQAKASYQDESLNWKPGGVVGYNFKIQNGELQI